MKTEEDIYISLEWLRRKVACQLGIEWFIGKYGVEEPSVEEFIWAILHSYSRVGGLNDARLSVVWLLNKILDGMYMNCMLEARKFEKYIWICTYRDEYIAFFNTTDINYLSASYSYVFGNSEKEAYEKASEEYFKVKR